MEKRLWDVLWRGTKGRAVRTSYNWSVLDPATSLRYAQDDVGWRMLERVRIILNFRWYYS